MLWLVHVGSEQNKSLLRLLYNRDSGVIFLDLIMSDFEMLRPQFWMRDLEHGLSFLGAGPVHFE